MAIFRAREGYETISLGDCFAESGHFFYFYTACPILFRATKLTKCIYILQMVFA